MTIEGVGAIASPALNSAIRSAKFVFDLKAVAAQAKDYLETIAQVRSDVSYAKTLRRRTSAFLFRDEKCKVDETVANTEKALKRLAKLVERPRVDFMVNKNGSLGLTSRVIWVVKDQGSVQAALAMLNTTIMSLQTQVGFMAPLGRGPSAMGVTAEKDSGTDRKPPPPYEIAKGKVHSGQGTGERKGQVRNEFDVSMQQHETENEEFENKDDVNKRATRASSGGKVPISCTHFQSQKCPSDSIKHPAHPYLRDPKNVPMTKLDASPNDSNPSVLRPVSMTDTERMPSAVKRVLRRRQHHSLLHEQSSYINAARIQHDYGNLPSIESTISGSTTSPVTPISSAFQRRRSRRWLDNQSPIPRDCVGEV